MCNCRKNRMAQARSVVKRTMPKNISTSTNPINRQNGVVNGRRIITRTIK